MHHTPSHGMRSRGPRITMASKLKQINLLAFVVILVLGAGTGCTFWANQPARTLPIVPARDLLVGIDAFPDRWGIDPCEPACGQDRGDAYAERSFGMPDVAGHVLQDVFRLDSVAAAQATFQTYREVDFRKHPPPRTPSSEFVPPPEVSYHSPLADDSYFGCGVDVVPACRAIIRYGQYVVSFYIDVNHGTADGVVITTEEGLTIADIEPILRALDHQGAASLGLPLPPPTESRRKER